MWELELLIHFFSTLSVIFAATASLEDLYREGAHDLLVVGDLLSQSASSNTTIVGVGDDVDGTAWASPLASSRVESRKIVRRVVLGDGSNRCGLPSVLLLLR